MLGGRDELEGTTVLSVRKDVTERPHAKSLQGGRYRRGQEGKYHQRSWVTAGGQKGLVQTDAGNF